MNRGELAERSVAAMLGTPSNTELEPRDLECTFRIRAAVIEEHEPLLRSIAVLVAKSGRGLAWPEVMELAAEILHDAVQQALEHAGRFDSTRSATAWVRGIAAKLLLTRRRDNARAWRCMPAAVLGEEAWATALRQRWTDSADGAVAGRLDLEQALSRVSPEERRTIELRYYQGLDGEALAAALGVATPGAARVRVCRALQSLRTHFAPTEEEVSP
jgi:RNA polymerase sigma factor (sigma-70 family)